MSHLYPQSFSRYLCRHQLSVSRMSGEFYIQPL